MDTDGGYFIDYLKMNINISNQFLEGSFGFFSNDGISNLIQTGLKSKDLRVKEKYEWIVKKHNQLVDKKIEQENSFLNYFNEVRETHHSHMINKKIDI